MADLSHWQYTLAALCALMVGLTKTGLPGLSILAVPLLAQIMDPKQSTGFMLPMLIFGDIFAVLYYRRDAVWPHLVRLIPWTLTGIVTGSLALRILESRQVSPLIGLIVLAMLILGWWRETRAAKTGDLVSEGRHPWWLPATLGFLAGFTTMVANAAGPVMAIYLLAMSLPKIEFLGTGAWFFLVVNWIKVPFMAKLGLITVQSLTFNAKLFPLVLIGAIAGITIQKRIPQKAFNTTVQVLAAVAAIKLFF
jgi:uncharacterized membrane protein YfcA